VTAIVFYDLEIVTADDIRRATGVVGGDAIHVYPTDAIWPAPAGVPSATVWPQRDYRFRELVMDQFDRLAKSAGKVLHHDIDLLEATRYEWVFATEDMFHRGWTVEELVRRYRPARLHWVSRDARYLQVVRAACTARRIRCSVDCSPLSRIRSAVCRPRDFVRNRLWLLREKHRSRRHMAEIANRRAAAPIPRAPILFAEIYPNNTQLAVRISDAMKQLTGVGGVFVGGRKEVCDLVLASGLPCFLMDEFRPTRSAPFPTSKFTAQLRRGIQDAFARGANALSPPTDGGIGDVVEPVLRHMAQVGRNLLTVAFDWSERTREMIRQLKPKAIVSTTYAGIFGRVLALAAEAHRIPAAYVQHGILGEGRFLSHFPYDRLLLWGENVVRAYHSQGVPLERMRVVGSPLYDEAEQVQNRSHSIAPSNNDSASRILLLASRPGGSVVNATLFERILRATAAAVLAKPNRSLTVKLHPADHSGIAQRLFGSHERVHVVEMAKVSDLLLDCDAAVVTSSTTGLEACVCDKPLIEFDPTGTQPMVDYARYGAALCVGRESDLNDALEKALGDESVRRDLAAGRRRLLADLLNGGCCNATEGAAREILNMINEARVPVKVPS
jgi:hypothetical protein